MVESAAYSRRGFLGGCVATTITGSLAAGATSVVVGDASTWAGLVTNGNSRVMIDRAGATPEEIEISAVAGNTLTISARGLQGTSNATHAAGVTIEVIHSPRDFNEANYWVAELAGASNAAGDLPYSDGADSLARLAIGTARQQLATNAGATAPEWVASLQSLLTATGDIIRASAANTPQRLAIGSTGDVLTVAGGVPTWAAASSSFVGAGATTNATQAITTGATAAVAFATEAFDSSTFHDTVTNNSRFTVPASLGGKYLLTWTVLWVNGATVTGLIQFYVKVNGAIVNPSNILVRPEELSASSTQSRNGSALLSLAAGDYVEVFLDNASGSTATVQTSSTMQVARIGT